MDLQVNRKAIALFMQIFNSKDQMKATIEERSIKPVFVETTIKQPFERVDPEDVGFSSEKIIEFYKKIKEDETLDMHGLMIAKDGKVISESNFGPYKQNIWHITHSECKSITSLAIGLLVDDNKLHLEDRLIDIFSEECNPLVKISHRGIKVKDLLTMRSGVSFAEIGALVETEWMNKFFESSPGLDVGKKFHYNSMNSYMLSAIVNKISGKKMLEFLKERLFDEMQIENIYWEESPENIEKGGWGLYILPEDMLKIGQLVLNRGVWNGKQLISSDWIEEATSVQVKAKNIIGEFDYGYHIWVGEYANTFLFNGMFGQNMIGNFENNTLVLLNAGNNDIFQSSSIFTYYDDIFNKYENRKVLSSNRSSKKEVMKIRADLTKYPRIIKRTKIEQLIFENKREHFFKKQEGVTWVVAHKITNTTSILPFFVQAIQNNFTKGMSELWFERNGKNKYLVVREVDEIYKIPFNFNAYEYTDLSFHGETHRISVMARAAQNEDGFPVLTMKLYFLEIANTRTIKIIFEENGKMSIELKENPGKDMIAKAIQGIKEELTKKPIFHSFNIPLTDELISFLIETVTNPKIVARKKKGLKERK